MLRTRIKPTQGVRDGRGGTGVENEIQGGNRRQLNNISKEGQLDKPRRRDPGGGGPCSADPAGSTQIWTTAWDIVGASTRAPSSRNGPRGFPNRNEDGALVSKTSQDPRLGQRIHCLPPFKTCMLHRRRSWDRTAIPSHAVPPLAPFPLRDWARGPCRMQLKSPSGAARGEPPWPKPVQRDVREGTKSTTLGLGLGNAAGGQCFDSLRGGR